MEQHYPRLLSRIRVTSLASAFLVVLGVQAAHVPEAVARQVGENFFARPSIGRQATDLSLIYTAAGSADGEPLTCFYVFNEASGGFVVIAADDVIQPVLAYSTDQAFDGANVPSNVAKWVDGYKTEILFAIEGHLIATPEVAVEWEALLRDVEVNGTGGGARAVDPLLQTTWNQSPYYNAQCPGGSVTGCVATAMAQIMKFWNYPATGSGFHQYSHPQYGTLSANFGNTSYQWSSMPNNVSSPNGAVATLMYHCVVGVEMVYSPQVSGAWVIEDHSPTTDHNAEYALKTYFGYVPSLNGVARANYSQSQWINLLRNELDAARPILYDGFGDGGGHAFVCDGYDDNNFFHFNWGWGGAYDGYFTVNALNPSGTGTGGGTGGYNSGQEAVIGVQPPSASLTYDMSLYDYVDPTSSTLYYGQAFSVTTNIANDGSNNFSGDYCAAAFDDVGNFVGYIQILTGYGLQAGFVYTNGLTFSTTGLFGMVPGDYTIGIFYRPTGGNWVSVSDSWPYYNYPEVTVINENDIELNSSITVSPGGNLVQGGQVSVNLNILNDGSATFYGAFGVALYNLDGSWAQDIGTLTESSGLPSGFTYLAPYLTFGPTTITVSPGTYLLAVQHNPSGTGWQLTGSGNFINPVTVTVVAPSISPDVYEANNMAAQSYSLPVNFSGNNASPNTIGSNLHVTSDLDHYKVVLAAGYDYTITARLHDSYNSGNGNTYTADALFSWSTDGSTWSSTYDDIMPGNISEANGGTIYFRVAPFFAGEVGTYLLQLNITRSALVGIEEQYGLIRLNLFPNPATDAVTIDLTHNVKSVERIFLTDYRGAAIKEFGVGPLISGTMTLSLADVADGSYLLNVHTKDGRTSARITISQ